MILFLNTMTRTTGIVLSRAHIEQAAKLTFLNVILLSLICTLIDDIRRRVMIRRPVRQIMNAAECIQKGDFSVCIPALRGIDEMNGFGEIVTCFNQMAEELSGIETLRSDFIANVSHELKTPLAVMQNYGTMLQQPSLSEAKRVEYARAIIDTSRLLASLITNILKLNKLENQQIFPDVKTYDLSEQLCACLLDLENAWEKKELNIETDIEEGVMVESDAELLALVWHNSFPMPSSLRTRMARCLWLCGQQENMYWSVSQIPAAVFPGKPEGTSSRNFIKVIPLMRRKATGWVWRW